MARRGRSRKDRPRTPTGQPSRAGRSATDPGINALLLAHRLDPIDAEAAEKLRRAQLQLDRFPAGYLRTPQEAARQRECVDIVHTSGAAAKNPNLSFPLGIFFECGRKSLADLKAGQITQQEFESRFVLTEAEFKAGDHYARLHRAVWGDIHKDIAAYLGPDCYNLLLETGPVKAPSPPSSLFRNLLPADRAPISDQSPEERVKRRLQIADRLGKARAALMSLSADYWYCLIVESVVIEGRGAKWLTPRVATADAHMRQSALKKGLALLAEHFGFDRAERRQATPPAPAAGPAGSPQPLGVADVLAAAERRSERRGKGLDVVFSPEIDGRTDLGTVSQSVDKFLRRRTKLPPAA